MSTEVPLECACGSVQGTAIDVSPRRDTRVVCMCDDCQIYAHWLGSAERVLDEYGGTDIFQLAPAQLRITTGVEHIACVRLTDKGPMRWYAECCRTPIANTLASPRFPFAGVVHTFMDHEGDGRSRDEALGPVRARINARYCPGQRPADAHDKAPLGLILRAVRQLLGGFIRGAARPSPFFDAQGKPIAEAFAVSDRERGRLRVRAGI